MIGRNMKKNNKLNSFARYAAGIAGSLALLYTGCSMCAGPFDYDYPSFGGAVQRSNPTWGRVGSVYSDPGPFGGPSSDSNLRPHETGSGLPSDTFEAVPEPEPQATPRDLELELRDPNQFNDGSGTRNGGSDTRNGGSGTRNGSSDILPAPEPLPQPGPQTRPAPDEETTRSFIPLLRNQSRNRVRRWR